MSQFNESFFVTILKSLFKGFFFLIGILFALVTFVIIISSFLSGKQINKSEQKNTPTILPDLADNTSLISEKSPVVLQINIHGIIGAGNTTSESIESMLRESRQNFLKNDRVKAILLHMNTRGGTVTDSDNIYRMLMEYKEKYKIPIYAFVDGINASGGVYITSAADKIFATPVSIIGSVGVLSGPFINLSKGMEKLGIESLTLTEGKDKDMLNPLRPWKEDETASFKMIDDYYYQRFVDILANSRPLLSKEKLLSTYGAHVFPAPIAEKYGYIDKGNAGYKDTLKELLEAASINPDQPYQVICLESKKNIAQELFENSALFNGKMTHHFKIDTLFHEKSNEKLFFMFNP